jgi:Family of unknown function (DUF6152)
MKTFRLYFVIVFAIFLVMSRPAGAHHGYAAFDTSADVTLKGTVTDFHFVNPHCIIEFDVKDEKGGVQNWKAELTSANHLAPKGWTESSVQAGDEIAITGYRAKNGAPSIWVTKIHLANGQELNIDTAN